MSAPNHRAAPRAATSRRSPQVQVDLSQASPRGASRYCSCTLFSNTNLWLSSHLLGVGVVRSRAAGVNWGGRSGFALVLEVRRDPRKQAIHQDDSVPRAAGQPRPARTGNNCTSGSSRQRCAPSREPSRPCPGHSNSSAMAYSCSGVVGSQHVQADLELAAIQARREHLGDSEGRPGSMTGEVVLARSGCATHHRADLIGADLVSQRCHAEVLAGAGRRTSRGMVRRTGDLREPAARRDGGAAVDPV